MMHLIPGRNRRGFLFSLEALLSFMFLLVSLSFLAFFDSRPSIGTSAFFTCSDASGVLAKSNAFDGVSLQEKVAALESLSGLCIEARTDLTQANSSCAYFSEEKYSFNFPVFADSHVQHARVSCWHAKMPGG